MNTWLDTKTKAILRNSPPNKLAPPDVKGFTLVLLSFDHCQKQRLARAIQRICLGTTAIGSVSNLEKQLPVNLKNELTESDALIGQFELICCDAISVFISDNVAKFGSDKYLLGLYDALSHSDEFLDSHVTVNAIPNSEAGAEFVDQFFGSIDKSPFSVTVPFKKAKILTHWGSKIGADIRINT